MADDKRGAGFAGLKDLLPDVDEHLKQAQDKSKAATKPAVLVDRPDASDTRSAHIGTPTRIPPEAFQTDPGRWAFISENKGALVVLGLIIGAIALLGAFSEPSKKGTPVVVTPVRPPTVTTPPPQPPSPAPNPPRTLLDQVSRPEPPRPAAPVLPIEVKPPVGSEMSLSTEQVRYCVFESTRIDVLSPLINNFAAVEVDGFNAYVADYNIRCSRFRYRRGTLESVRADAQRYRGFLEQQAHQRLAQWR